MSNKQEQNEDKTKKESALKENPNIKDESASKEKMITIRIPRMKKDEEDVPVWVNERSWLIKRGVSVEVPECVAEVLRHQEEAFEQAYEFESGVKDK